MTWTRSHSAQGQEYRTVCRRLIKPPQKHRPPPRLSGIHGHLLPLGTVQEKNFTSHALHLETEYGPRCSCSQSDWKLLKWWDRGLLICFLLPATSNKMPGQSDHSTRINGNQLRAESWENCFFWKMKSQLGCGDWMTFYYSREMMIHRAEARGYEEGGQVLDWACGSRRVLSSGFSWCVSLFFWLPINLLSWTHGQQDWLLCCQWFALCSRVSWAPLAKWGVNHNPAIL